MTIDCPLILDPILKPKVWGGRRLERYGKALPPETAIGESWEVADLSADIAEDGRCRIAGGPHDGVTLHQLLADHRRDILGLAADTPGDFPLLIKYLDAETNLSVQVHPTQAYADRTPGANLKCEAWVILEAEPDAVIYAGLKDGIDGEAFADCVRSGRTTEALRAIPAVPGTCHYLPSGIIHALGAGVLVAEVQTPSDTTYRVDDWGRTDRTLHVEQALACVDPSLQVDQGPPVSGPISGVGVSTMELTRTAYFTIDRVLWEHEEAGIDVVTNDLPVIWMFTNGGATVRSKDGVVSAAHGTTLLVPAAARDVEIMLPPAGSALRVTLPHPTDRMLA